MAIVLISSLYQGGRTELAESLARKTNWPVLHRQELQDEARKLGIKVGRLEVAVMKTPGLSERLSREKKLYLNFVTAMLCEKAREGNLIYTGRAGHLMLPEVSHIIRVGLTAPREVRIKRTSQVLNLPIDKAESCLDQLDEDIDKWIHWVHQADPRNVNNFDALFNLENMAVSNAAALICAMAALPDFQPTPASTKKLEDLYLASRAKLRLALSERTADADLQVHAENREVTVTYPPHQDRISGDILRVLSNLEGCNEIQCTAAESNILWVGERFDVDSQNYHQLLQLAKRWGAAVELLCPINAEAGVENLMTTGVDHVPYTRMDRRSAKALNGGVEDDGPQETEDSCGLQSAEEALIGEGLFGGRHTVVGGYDKVLDAMQGDGHYSLVLIGDVFVSKGHSTQTRRTRELAMSIRDRLKTPVITQDMLESHFLFGKRQALKLLGFLCIAVVVYYSVFTHQSQVLDFLSGPVHAQHKWIAPIILALFIPIVAYLYGTITELALKIINID